jgi:hypothetical protein
MNKDRPAADEEDARLLRILRDCWRRVKVRRDALSHPTSSMLLPQYKNLVADLAMVRVEHAKALATLKQYRKSRRGPAALIAGTGAA